MCVFSPAGNEQCTDREVSLYNGRGYYFGRTQYAGMSVMDPPTPL